MSFLPQIIEISDDIIDTLVKDEFFVDFEIKDLSYAKRRFCEELTTKFVNGELDIEDGCFTEDEYDVILNEIIAEDLLRSLQKKGYVNSYEDDTTDEVFFLTEEGKKKFDNIDDVRDIKD